MAAPKKPKTGGVRTAKGKAAGSGVTRTPVMAASAPGSNGNGDAAPSAELIRRRAYEVFLARGETPGDELSDWLTAEREITEKFAPHN